MAKLKQYKPLKRKSWLNKVSKRHFNGCKCHPLAEKRGWYEEYLNQ